MASRFVAYGDGYSGDYDTRAEADRVVTQNGQGGVYELMPGGSPVQFDSGSLGGARYKFERIPRDMRVGFIGFSVEFDRTTAEAIARTAHPELVGPFAEWRIDDEGLCDLLSDEIERWLATFPLFLAQEDTDANGA